MSSGSVPKLFGRQTAIVAIESGMADALLVRALDRATLDQLDAASIAKRGNTNGWTLLDCNESNSSVASRQPATRIPVAGSGPGVLRRAKRAAAQSSCRVAVGTAQVH